MKHYLLTFFLLVGLKAFPQPFAPFHKERPAYFNIESNVVLYYDQAGISIDSFHINGSDTVFYHYSVIDWTNGGPCPLNGKDSSFVNTQSIRNAAGNDIFFNMKNDSIYLIGSSTLGTEWIMFRYGNGDVLKATVTSIDWLPVLGVNDSVKTIMISAEDNSGNEISHLFNGKIFKIGKTSGLVSGYSFFHLPTDTLAFNLVGIENPPAGLSGSVLSPEKIFDYNEGDRFDYIGGAVTWPTYQLHYYITKKILSKSVSSNGDTITYGTEIQYFGETLDFGNYTSISQTTTADEVIVLSDYKYLYSRPSEVFDLAGNGAGFLTLTKSIYDSTATAITVDPDYMHDNDDCLQIIVATILPLNRYAAGLGRPYMYGGEMNSNIYDTLVYYNKNGVEWGDSINWLTLGLDDKQPSVNVAIFPNPSASVIHVNGNFGAASAECTLINSLGVSVKAKEISHSNQSMELDVSDLPAGIYMVKIRQNNATFTGKLIKE
jgi:hypothetical protein